MRLVRPSRMLLRRLVVAVAVTVGCSQVAAAQSNGAIQISVYHSMNRNHCRRPRPACAGENPASTNPGRLRCQSVACS